MSQELIDWDLEFDLSGARPEPEPTKNIQQAEQAELSESEVSSGVGSAITVPQRGGVLYIDIETVPDYDRQSSFGLPPLPVVPGEIEEDALLPPDQFLSQTLKEIDAWFARYNPVESWLQKLEEQERKTPGKAGNRKGVFDAIAKARSAKNATEDVAAAQNKKMSVTPEMCRIVALGFAVDDGPVQSLVVGVDDKSERDLLDVFWRLAQGAEQICGFNLLEFDLPAIFVRSILLSVPATRSISLDKYRSNVVDLFVRRFGGSRSGESADVKTSRGLKSLARQLGLTIPCEGVDGSQVAEIFRTNPAALAQYVESDIIVTRKLHRLYEGYFC